MFDVLAKLASQPDSQPTSQRGSQPTSQPASQPASPPTQPTQPSPTHHPPATQPASHRGGECFLPIEMAKNRGVLTRSRRLSKSTTCFTVVFERSPNAVKPHEKHKILYETAILSAKESGGKQAPLVWRGFFRLFLEACSNFHRKTRAFCACRHTFVVIYRDFGAPGHVFVAIYVVPVALVTDLSLFTWFRWLGSQICYLRGYGGLVHRFVASLHKCFCSCMRGSEDSGLSPFLPLWSAPPVRSILPLRACLALDIAALGLLGAACALDIAATGLLGAV